MEPTSTYDLHVDFLQLGEDPYIIATNRRNGIILFEGYSTDSTSTLVLFPGQYREGDLVRINAWTSEANASGEVFIYSQDVER